MTDVKALEEEIEKERQKQDEAAAKEDFKTAQEAKDKIKELQAKIDNQSESQKVEATINDVAKSVERLTGIPFPRWEQATSSV